MKKYYGAKKRLKIYIDSTDRYNSKPLWEEIVKKVQELNIAGATVTKAVAGVGAFSQLHTFSVVALSQKLPLIIEIIDDKKKIENFLENIDVMIEEGLCTIDDVEVVSYKKRGI